MGGTGWKNAMVAAGLSLALAGCQSLSQPAHDSLASVLHVSRWGRAEQPEEKQTQPTETPAPAAAPVAQQAAPDTPPLPDAVNDVVRNLLASLNTTQMTSAPCILVDPAGFPSQDVPAETVEDLVGRLRIELNRAANGNVYFISPVQIEIQKAKGRGEYQYRLNGHFSASAPGGPTAHPCHQLDLQLQDTAGAAVWNGACSFVPE